MFSNAIANQFEDSDDSISVTSTVASEPEEDQTYIVHSILAEKFDEASNQMIYLVRWDGYEIERSTWEPREMFDDLTVLDVWEEGQRNGTNEYYDYEDFDEKAAAAYEEKLNRQKRRARKRARLGLKRQKNSFSRPVASRRTSGAKSSRQQSRATSRDLKDFVTGDDDVQYDSTSSEHDSGNSDDSTNKRGSWRKKKKSTSHRLSTDESESEEAVVLSSGSGSSSDMEIVQTTKAKKVKAQGKRTSQAKIDHKPAQQKRGRGRPPKERLPTPPALHTGSRQKKSKKEIEPVSSSRRNSKMKLSNTKSSVDKPPEASKPKPLAKKSGGVFTKTLREAVGSKTMTTRPTAPAQRNGPVQPFRNLQHQNAVMKKNREEPAPQLEALELFHPSEIGRRKSLAFRGPGVRRDSTQVDTRDDSIGSTASNAPDAEDGANRQSERKEDTKDATVRPHKRPLTKSSRDLPPAKRIDTTRESGMNLPNADDLKDATRSMGSLSMQKKNFSSPQPSPHLEQSTMDWEGDFGPRVQSPGFMSPTSTKPPLLLSDPWSASDPPGIDAITEDSTNPLQWDFVVELEYGATQSKKRSLGPCKFIGFSPDFTALAQRLGLKTMFMALSLDHRYIQDILTKEDALGKPLEYADIECLKDTTAVTHVLTILHGVGVIVHPDFTILVFQPSNEILRKAFQSPQQRHKTQLRAVAYPPVNIKLQEFSDSVSHKPFDDKFKYYLPNLLFRTLGLDKGAPDPKANLLNLLKLSANDPAYCFVYAPPMAYAESTELETALKTLGHIVLEGKDQEAYAQKRNITLRIFVHHSHRRTLHLVPYLRTWKCRGSASFFFFGMRLEHYRETDPTLALDATYTPFYTFGTLCLVTPDFILQHTDAMDALLLCQSRKAGSWAFCITANLKDRIQDAVLKTAESLEAGHLPLPKLQTTLKQAFQLEAKGIDKTALTMPFSSEAGKDEFEKILDAFLMVQVEKCTEYRHFKLYYSPSEAPLAVIKSKLYGGIDFVNPEQAIAEAKDLKK